MWTQSLPGARNWRQTCMQGRQKSLSGPTVPLATVQLLVVWLSMWEVCCRPGNAVWHVPYGNFFVLWLTERKGNQHKCYFFHQNLHSMNLFMQWAPSWEAGSYSAGQEKSCLLRNIKVNYLVHSSPQLDHILSQINPVHTTIPCIFKIYVTFSLQNVFLQLPFL